MQVNFGGAVCVAGTCTKDAELKYVGEKQTPMCTFSLAVVRGAIAIPAAHEVPAWLEALLRRALSVEPHERFPDMHALLDAIEHGRRPRAEARFDTRQVEAVLQRGGELGVLAGELGVAVVLREAGLHRAGVACSDANELVLEAGDEGVGADHDLDALAGAAVEERQRALAMAQRQARRRTCYLSTA